MCQELGYRTADDIPRQGECLLSPVVIPQVCPRGIDSQGAVCTGLVPQRWWSCAPEAKWNCGVSLSEEILDGDGRSLFFLILAEKHFIEAGTKNYSTW